MNIEAGSAFAALTIIAEHSTLLETARMRAVGAKTGDMVPYRQSSSRARRRA
jgi:hypothetical protein